MKGKNTTIKIHWASDISDSIRARFPRESNLMQSSFTCVSGHMRITSSIFFWTQSPIPTISDKSKHPKHSSVPNTMLKKADTSKIVIFLMQCRKIVG